VTISFVALGHFELVLVTWNITAPRKAERVGGEPVTILPHRTTLNPNPGLADQVPYDKMEYTPLEHDKDQIRLLTLAPRKKSRRLSKFLSSMKPNKISAKIECSLELASFEESPDYEALSYVWGDKTDTLDIIVDGKRSPVTKNLHSALLHLQLEDRERILWVDALCINQSDTDERAHQVSRMRKIYAEASSVVVWLGKESDSMNTALDIISMLSSNEGMHLTGPISPHLNIKGRGLESSDLQKSLIRFFRNAWWTRVWTVQEFAMAGGGVFQSGFRSLSFENMEKFSRSYFDHEQNCCVGAQLSTRSSEFGISALTAVNQFNFLIDVRSREESFLTILAMFRGRSCSDPLDKIYGMLGLARNVYKECVTPDYTRTVEEVFEAFVLELIKRTGELEIFSHVLGRQLAGLPSFVPDWTDEADTKKRMSSHLRRLDILTLYNASGGRKEEIKIVSAGMISTPCLKIDIIADIQPPDTSLGGAGLLRSWRRMSDVSDSSTDTYFHTNQLRIEAFYRTLFGDVDHSGATYPPRRMGDNFEHEMMRQWSVWVLTKNEQETPVKEQESLRYDQKTLRRYHRGCVQMTGRRGFILTRKGYMGFANQNCRVGDIIVVLPGGRVPYIFREAPDMTVNNGDESPLARYQLIGDAYLHGIMDGEAFTSITQPPIKQETVLIV